MNDSRETNGGGPILMNITRETPTYRLLAAVFCTAALCLAGATPAWAQSNEGYVSLNLGAGVAVIEPVNGPLGINVITTIAIPGSNSLNGIAVTPDGSTVYVAGGGGAGRVWAIDTLTQAVLPPTTGIPVGVFPEGVAISPDGNWVFVANFFSNSVSIIEVASNSVVSTVGGIPSAFAVTAAETSNGPRVYATDLNGGNVAVIDVADPLLPSIVATIDVKTPPGTGVAGPQGITSTPDGSTVYVANGTSNEVVEIDTASNAITNRVGVTGSPFGIATNADGSLVYASIRAPRDVVVVDTSSFAVSFVGLDAPGADPVGLGITPDGAFVATANQQANRVTVIDTATLDDETAPVAAPGRGRYVAFIPASAPPPPDDPPVWDDPPACGALPILAQVGVEVMFTVGASDAGDELTLSAAGLPAGASSSETLPAVGADAVATTVTWTPVAADVGTHAIDWNVLDVGGQTAAPAPCTITIEVEAPPVLDTEFAAFYLRFAKVSKRGRFADSFYLNGNFTVDTENGDNIDPVNEETVITFEGQTFTIPATSFRSYWRGRLFYFKGTIDGGRILVYIRKRGRSGEHYNISVAGWKAKLNAENPLEIDLKISDDFGSASKNGWIRK